MLEVLRSSGRVMLYDIPLVSPFRVVLAAFLAKDRKVTFSAGAGAGISIDIAAHKALLELYQAFVLMDQLIDQKSTYGFKESTEDRMSNNYLECNNSRTVSEFKAILDARLAFDIEPWSVPNWRADVKNCQELVHHQTLEFGSVNPGLTYCSIHLVSGFPAKSPLSNYPAASEVATSSFDLGIQRRSGPVPFG